MNLSFRFITGVMINFSFMTLRFYMLIWLCGLFQFLPAQVVNQPKRPNPKTIRIYYVEQDHLLSDLETPSHIDSFNREGGLEVSIFSHNKLIYRDLEDGFEESLDLDLLSGTQSSYTLKSYQETDSIGILTIWKYQENEIENVVEFTIPRPNSPKEGCKDYGPQFSFIPDSIPCDTCSFLEQTIWTMDQEGREKREVEYAVRNSEKGRILKRKRIKTFDWASPDICVARTYEPETDRLVLSNVYVVDSTETLLYSESYCPEIELFSSNDALALPKPTYKWNEYGDWVECTGHVYIPKIIRQIEYYD